MLNSAGVWYLRNKWKINKLLWLALNCKARLLFRKITAEALRAKFRELCEWNEKSQNIKCLRSILSRLNPFLRSKPNYFLSLQSKIKLYCIWYHLLMAGNCELSSRIASPQYNVFLFRIDYVPNWRKYPLLWSKDEARNAWQIEFLYFYFLLILPFVVTVIYSFVIETRVRWVFSLFTPVKPFSATLKGKIFVKPFSLFDF